MLPMLVVLSRVLGPPVIWSARLELPMSVSTVIWYSSWRPAMVPVTLPESALSVMSGLAKASRSMLPMFTVQAARRRLFLKSMAKQLPKHFHFFSVKAIIPLEAH